MSLSRQRDGKQRFTIKKFKVGVASVLIGTVFLGFANQVKAEEMTDASDVVVNAITTDATPASETSETSTPASETSETSALVSETCEISETPPPVLEEAAIPASETSETSALVSETCEISETPPPVSEEAAIPLVAVNEADENFETVEESDEIVRTINYVKIEPGYHLVQAADPFVSKVKYYRTGLRNRQTGDTEWNDWVITNDGMLAGTPLPQLDGYIYVSTSRVQGKEIRDNLAQDTTTLGLQARYGDLDITETVIFRPEPKKTYKYDFVKREIQYYKILETFEKAPAADSFISEVRYTSEGEIDAVTNTTTWGEWKATEVRVGTKDPITKKETWGEWRPDTTGQLMGEILPDVEDYAHATTIRDLYTTVAKDASEHPIQTKHGDADITEVVNFKPAPTVEVKTHVIKREIQYYKIVEGYETEAAADSFVSEVRYISKGSKVSKESDELVWSEWRANEVRTGKKDMTTGEITWGEWQLNKSGQLLGAPLPKIEGYEHAGTSRNITEKLGQDGSEQPFQTHYGDSNVTDVVIFRRSQTPPSNEQPPANPEGPTDPTDSVTPQPPMNPNGPTDPIAPKPEVQTTTITREIHYMKFGENHETTVAQDAFVSEVRYTRTGTKEAGSETVQWEAWKPTEVRKGTKNLTTNAITWEAWKADTSGQLLGNPLPTIEGYEYVNTHKTQGTSINVKVADDSTTKSIQTAHGDAPIVETVTYRPIKKTPSDVQPPVEGSTPPVDTTQPTPPKEPRTETVSETKKITRTIHYNKVEKNGTPTKAAESFTSEVEYTRTGVKNLETQDVKWNDWQATGESILAGNPLPTLEGYVYANTVKEQNGERKEGQAQNSTTEGIQTTHADANIVETVTFVKLEAINETTSVKREIRYNGLDKDNKPVAIAHTFIAEVRYTRQGTLNPITQEKTWGEWVVEVREGTKHAVTGKETWRKWETSATGELPGNSLPELPNYVYESTTKTQGDMKDIKQDAAPEKGKLTTNQAIKTTPETQSIVEVVTYKLVPEAPMPPVKPGGPTPTDPAQPMPPVQPEGESKDTKVGDKNLENDDKPIYDLQADADGDGYGNFVELVLGSDPNDKNSIPQPKVSPIDKPNVKQEKPTTEQMNPETTTQPSTSEKATVASSTVETASTNDALPETGEVTSALLGTAAMTILAGVGLVTTRKKEEQ